MHRTRLAVLTALAALLALVAPVLTSAPVAATPAGRAAARPVATKDLPSRSEIVHAIPDLAGLHLFRASTPTTGQYAGVCSKWAETGVRYGELRSGEDFSTGRTIDVRVLQLTTSAQARALLAAYQAFVRDCSQYWAGIATTVQPERLPKLGGPRVGYRATTTPAAGTGLAPSHYFTVAVRKGKRVLVIEVQQPASPRKAQVVRLARIAAARMA
ncbi:hypothetical protein ACFFOS_15300 [Nocardioides kongjuensis]|uniref:Sensor domain-containing protein n=1 Tax=Nocardioides kongjuensis TaxID=349522 RepID=A0A852RTG6_9ACTN|nr:hypothetical protein [Nocardioides kongjuensis]NYD32516.1 hypothetical protein [Nocardioides kongjuensis]